MCKSAIYRQISFLSLSTVVKERENPRKVKGCYDIRRVAGCRSVSMKCVWEIPGHLYT